MMPLLAAPGHEWSTMLTVLKQVQNITTVVMEDSHKTVITFDLQLYEKAIKLQLYAYCTSIRSLCFPTWRATYGDDSIAALGTSIEDSGFDYALAEAGIYGSTTRHQIFTESLNSLYTINLTMPEWYRSSLRKWNSSNEVILTYMRNS